MDFSDGKWKTGVARSGIFLLQLGLATLPGGFWLSAGIGTLEATKGNDFYQWLEK